MRKWEDIVKDKLDGYERPLPEGSLARFHARMDGKVSTPAAKRFPLVWIVAAAAAAGFAAVLFLRQPVIPDDGIQIIQQPSTAVSVVADTADVTESIHTEPLIAQLVAPKAVRPSSVPPPAEIIDNEGEAEEIAAGTDEVPAILDAPAEPIIAKPIIEEPIITNTSPFIPKCTGSSTAGIKMGQAAAWVVGSGESAALLSALVFMLGTKDYTTDPGVVLPTHSMPLMTGLSVRVPVWGRLSITSGIDYSLYASYYDYGANGIKTQTAHYLGVPLRLDWTLASSRWMDFYIGGGLEGDCCIKAVLGGENIKKDGLGFSAFGVSGMQFNVTNRLGIYVEPGLYYTLPSDNRVLWTYRTQKPLMFSLTSGIRIDFCK